MYFSSPGLNMLQFDFYIYLLITTYIPNEIEILFSLSKILMKIQFKKKNINKLSFVLF